MQTKTPNRGIVRKALRTAAAGFGMTFSCLTVALAQSAPSQYLFTEKAGIVLLPATRVSDDAQKLAWSPDSARLISLNVHSLPQPPDISLHAQPQSEADFSIGRWNRLAQRSDVIWKRRFATRPMMYMDPTWVPQTSTLVLTITWMEPDDTPLPAPDGVAHTAGVSKQEVLWIDTLHSVVRELHIDSTDSLSISPKRPIALVTHVGVYPPRQPASITCIREDGSMGTTLVVDKHAIVPQGWSEDGKKAWFVVITPGPDRAHPTKSYAEFDPATNTFTPIAMPSHPATPQSTKGDSTADLSLKASLQHVREAETDSVIHPLWAVASFASDHSRMLVSANADQGVLSPDGEIVAYRAEGSSWVAPLKQYPLAEFKSMVAMAQRTTTISNAKQLGLALIMYASDDDDNLPPPGDVQKLLTPYLLNSSLFQGFEYTYNGGPLTSIASPAETELGYVDGPGGQAVIYSDGHVKWRDR